jgi:succinoglycan biosynthesis protein ExoV
LQKKYYFITIKVVEDFMRLQYYKKPNFGDALNPMIFNKFLPNFFDDNPEQDFFGIGSIIGLPIVKKAKHKIIFSSGFAYGKIPQIDSSYDIVCVRGPLSSEALKLDKKMAVADGALLLKEFSFKPTPKEYRFSFMPHWDSEHRYPWDRISKEAGVHYISPSSDPDFVIQEILKSECVIAEAMHFAIVADTLRVPWIPVKSYSSINNFKWEDWAMSLNMSYDPVSLAPLYEHEVIKNFLKRKTSGALPEPVYNLVASTRSFYEDVYLKSRALKGFEEAKSKTPQLSKESILNSKVEELQDRLYQVEKRYRNK